MAAAGPIHAEHLHARGRAGGEDRIVGVALAGVARVAPEPQPHGQPGGTPPVVAFQAQRAVRGTAAGLTRLNAEHREREVEAAERHAVEGNGARHHPVERGEADGEPGPPRTSFTP